MKKQILRSLVVAMVISVLSLSSLALPFERSIEGTWRTSVTQFNCQTGTAMEPFPGILTFNKGGTLVGTSSTVTTAFGIWQAVRGSQNYNFAFTNLRYDPSGVVIGSQIVRQAVTLDASGDGFTSTGTAQFLDLNGNVVGNGCARSVGTRFE